MQAIRCHCDAWGRPLTATGSSVRNPLRYRGYVYDEETGFYFCNTRYYNPQWRRWLNADSYFVAGNSLTASNMYAYCNGNPVNLVDPSGMGALEIIWNNIVSVWNFVFSSLSSNIKAMADVMVMQDPALLTLLASAASAGATISWTPVGWLILAGVGAAAVGVGIGYGITSYQKAQANKNKTVDEILKSKRASIKQAPLKPGGPSWDDIGKLTLAEIQRRAKKGHPDYHYNYSVFYKVLNEARFDK